MFKKLKKLVDSGKSIDWGNNEEKALDCLKLVLGGNDKSILAPDSIDYVLAEIETVTLKKLLTRYNTKIKNIKWDELKIRLLLGPKGAVYYLKHSAKTRLGSNFTKLIWDGIAKPYQKTGKLPDNTQDNIEKYINGTKKGGGRAKYENIMAKTEQPLDPKYQLNLMKVITCLLIYMLLESKSSAVPKAEEKKIQAKNPTETLEIVPTSKDTFDLKEVAKVNKYKKIRIMQGVQSIKWSRNNAEGIGKIKEIVLPEGLHEICDDTFENLFELEKVSLPDSLTKIGKSAFYGCMNLESITIPRNVTEIGEDAFGICEKLKNVKMPKRFKENFDVTDAFEGCVGLSEDDIIWAD